MFNPQFEEEYKQVIEVLRNAIRRYTPFLENQDRWLSEEAIEVSNRLDQAEKRWIEIRSKYLGLEK